MAFAGAAAITPLLRWLSVRSGTMIDTPSARKIHTVPIPRIGGLAIWLALWATALVATRFIPAETSLSPTTSIPSLSAIFAAATVILLVGVIDDRRSSTPLAKLVGQILACSILVVSGIHFLVFDQAWIDIPLTYVWVIGLINAFNLLDNMDGLSAGVALIAGAFFLLLAILSGQVLVGLLAVALVGSCLGFLLYNSNPASIFMGDMGSLSLGFLLAVLGLKLDVHNSPHRSFVVATIVLSLPIFDTTLVIWRRLREGRSIAQGGKDHTSHRLVNAGLSQKAAVRLLYGASVASGLSAFVLSEGTHRVDAAMLLLGGMVVGCAGYFLARIKTQATPIPEPNPSPVSAARPVPSYPPTD